MSQAATPPHSLDAGSHAAHAHPPFLKHHFDTPQQQYESSVQGMWLFLATEFLLFAGLFCAYAIYRAMHPEIFLYAHIFLDKYWGALNTVILLVSSFTMAAGVWAIEHGRPRLCVALLGLTILGGAGFMAIKYVEYKGKWEHGLLWGKLYNPDPHYVEKHQREHFHTEKTHRTPEGGMTLAPHADAPPPPATALPNQSATDLPSPTFAPPGSPGPSGVALGQSQPPELTPAQRARNVHIFFSIYFGMTGLHGLHVLAGMIAIGWVLVKTMRGAYSAAYYTPVHMVGLYWHVVDLIWIYLFPLLYLIH